MAYTPKPHPCSQRKPAEAPNDNNLVPAVLAVSSERTAVMTIEFISESAVKESVRPSKSAENSAACGSPNCGGCYEVAPGQRIHPPKSGGHKL